MATARQIAANRLNGRKGGYPKGRKRASTITKEQIRAHVQAKVAAALNPLVDAQLANAQGLKYLVTRDKKTGKFVRVTEAMARIKQASHEETIEVWEKDPCVQAFTDLMNRAADKPIEPVQVDLTAPTLETLLARLDQGRTNYAKAHPSTKF